jgi:hypothetical protein
MQVKLLIFLAVWKRPEITEICFMGINRLRKSGLFPIDVLAVISEVSMITLCKKYDIDYVMYKNEPLGEKKNFGLKVALTKDWDYLIEIGSDDLLKTEILEEYSKYFGKYHLIGLERFIFLNSDDLACREYRNASLFGVGRAMSRESIKNIGELWSNKLNRGLDNNSTAKFHRAKYMDVRIKKPLAIDIKSQVNIWPFNYLEGKKIDFETAVEGLSQEEINAICSLQKHQLESATSE